MAPINEPNVVRYIPDWFPGAGFKQMAREFRKTFQELVDVPFEFVKKQMVRQPAIFLPPNMLMILVRSLLVKRFARSHRPC